LYGCSLLGASSAMYCLIPSDGDNDNMVGWTGFGHVTICTQVQQTRPWAELHFIVWVWSNITQL
jgi:hypothetical protein